MKSREKQDQLRNTLNVINTLLRQKDEKPLNFVEAAKYLSISQSTLYKLTYQRKIPAHKPTGKLLYFFKYELDEWIKNGFSEHKAEGGATELDKDESEEKDAEEPP